ncbi:MAG: hypothetical protein A2X13_01640 [Bacteroidetes bacterium GWC2_33_15]|nr:MAG: hypothetical protein A2X10_07985 [Bacteroidetes bacterium GWA2_33_15]OFX52184.1 MAG: hypothetical protein A2X13_01640 [Bacteroidetes bacterium GWC2_33_15]OFX64338.1 MAG: hypothetical protein A2X15_12460 [Bacteroidetes bacterium GWB2_32_14]OFX67743.1 MAG: hypothetical protein A2X14_06285 [Bacteroidetes bacterium GWD2_33_33]HAN19354.1 hypothetical protein [Bacteroidales bacterium]
MTKSIIDFLKNNFQFYVFILVAIFLPVTKKYLPLVMSLWVLSGLIQIKKINLSNYKNLLILLFPFLYFILHIIGLLYTNNLKSGFFDLEVKLSIVFIPLITLFISQKVIQKQNQILQLFVISNFIISLVCLFFALKNSLVYNDLGNLIFEPSVWSDTKNVGIFKMINLRYSHFSYSYLSFIHHPSYYSMYITFSIVILIYFIKINKQKTWINFSLIIYFSVYIWLLASRAAYLIYFILLIGLILYLIKKYKKYLVLFAGIIAIGIAAVILLSNKQLNRNFKETYKILHKNVHLNEKSDIRLWLWKSGLGIYKNNLIYGIGTGDIDLSLDKKFNEYNLKIADEHNYNTHNQYLDVAVKLGTIGLVSLLLWMFYPIYLAIKVKYYLLILLILIVSINLIFENMLNTIAGTSFIVFFYSLLVPVLTIKEKELN